MKILVISHNAWIEMLCHAWSLAGMEIVEFKLPLVALARDEGLRLDTARRLAAEIERQQPGFVLDVNGAGVLPLKDEADTWTPRTDGIPWCVWWWDAPHLGAYPQWNEKEASQWLLTLKRPEVRHFIWDAVLAREYAVWLEKPFQWLPTATHAGMFNPKAFPYSKVSFAPVEVTFLGTYASAKPQAPLLVPASGDWDRAASARLRHPEWTYFELADRLGDEMPLLRAALSGARAGKLGLLNPAVLGMKAAVETLVGLERRTKPLNALREWGDPCFFGGKGWPPEFRNVADSFYQPAELVARYQNAVLNLDLKSSQCFTGTAMRSYEIMASGAVLMCERHPDFDPAGEWEGQAYLSFASAGELLDGIRKWRAEPQLLRDIRVTAREFVEQRHTWPNRLDALLSALR